MTRSVKPKEGGVKMLEARRSGDESGGVRGKNRIQLGIKGTIKLKLQMLSGLLKIFPRKSPTNACPISISSQSSFLKTHFNCVIFTYWITMSFSEAGLVRFRRSGPKSGLSLQSHSRSP